MVRLAIALLPAAFCAALALFAPPASAVITYVGKSSAADSSGSTRVVLALPAGTTTNDLMVVGISVKPGVTITTPAGWTLIRNDIGNDPNQYAYYKFRALGEVATSYTFTFSAASQGAGGMMVFRGTDLTSPIEASSGSSYPAGTAQTCNIGGKNSNIDPMQAPYLGSPGTQYLPTAGAMLVGFFSNGQDKTNITPPPLITTTATCTQDAAGTPPWTETVQQKSGGAGNGFTIEGSYQPTLCGVSGANCTGTRTAYATNNTTSADIAQMFALRPLQVLDHYYVTNNATGVNCQAENVTITAHDSSHNPVIMSAGSTITVTAQYVAGAGGGNRGDWTIASGGGSITSGTPDNGVATYTFPGGTSSVVLALKDTWVQTVRIVVTDGIFTSTSGTASADAGYAQNLSFVNSGFLITDGGAAPVAATIATQTAGTSSATYGLQAIRTDTNSGACVGVFASGTDVALDLAFQCNNPTTCVTGQNVTITNNGVSATIASNPNSGVSTYSTRSMRFGANSQALFSLNYPDVGAISLYVRYQIPLGTGAGSGNFMTGASNQFVVKPAGFTLSNVVRTADGFANPAAASAAGSLFIRAGSSFTATVTAVNSAGAATPNYGRENIPEGVTLTPTLVAGLGLTNNPALTNAAAFGAFSAGAATGTTFSWGEVGIITLAASVADGDYLGAGNVTGAPSGNIGRFAPFDFAVTRNSPSFSPACSGNFTYVGQAFNYSTAPVLAVTARNSAGATTQNYAGSFAKVTNATVTPNTTALRYSRFDALGAGTTPALDVSGLPTAASDPTIGAFVNGAGTLTFSGGGTGAVFTRSLEVAPFNADIALSISLSDTDGTLVASIDGAAGVNPVTFGAATSGNGISFNGGAKQMRFGRLVLSNAFGSELLDLPLPMETQYYSSSGAYVTNVNDSCTTLAASDLAFAFNGGTPNLVACETSVTPTTTLYFTSGKVSAAAPPATTPVPRLTKPGSGNNGTVDLTVNLGSASGNTCLAGTSSVATGANKPWLQWKWSGATYDKNPTARASFGTYKNADQFIYLRENF